MAMYQHGLVVALGVFLIVIGFVVPKLIEWQVKDTIRASLSVDSKTDSNYNDWAQATSSEATRKFLGYELTNPVQFMGGAAPNFAEWSLSDEVWYEWRKSQENVNFSTDRTQLTTNTRSQYFVRTTSPGSPTKKFLNINWAYVTLVSKTGSESALWSVLTNVMMGQMFATNLARWAGDSTYCLRGTVCGLLTYNASGHPIPTLTQTQIGLIAAKLPTVSWIGEYCTIIPIIYNPSTNAGVRAQYIAVANSKFTWFVFDTLPADGLYMFNYLYSLITNTTTTLVAAYSTTPYGLFFKNATIEEHVFGIDPLLTLLGQGTAILNNNSLVLNVIKTGYGDDTYLGMDYFVIAQNVANETRYPRGNYSVAGRQATVPPFQPRAPNFDIFFPTLMRFVRTNYVRDSEIKRVPTWFYAFDTVALGAIDPGYGTKVQGFADASYVSSGAPIWVSKPRMADADATWTSKITGMPAPTEDGESYINIEGYTGAGVEGAAKLLFNVFVNFTAYPITGLSAQSTNAYILPIFQAVDYRIMTDKVSNDLYKAVVFAPRVQTIVRLCLVIVGAVLLGGAIITYLYVLWSDQKQEKEVEMEIGDGTKTVETTDMGNTTDHQRVEFGLENHSNPLVEEQHGKRNLQEDSRAVELGIVS